MTGHLVLATLHANDALGAIARLEDLGLDRASIAATFRGAIAQRLVRRVCADCAHPIAADESLTAEEERLATQFGVRPMVRAVGCARCTNTGYCGRLPIHEIAAVTPEITGLIASGASVTTLNRPATAAGMRSLHSVALEAAGSGCTTLAEIERVLGDAEENGPEIASPAVTAGPVAVKSDQRTVLIVDDDSVQRFVCESILQHQGYAVVTAEDGMHALEVLRERKDIDLVVTDLHMPRLDGTGLVNSLRSSDEFAGLPLIVLTGSAAEGDDEVRLMDLGADDYLRKPVEPMRLIARVRAALRRATAESR
jgi:CheY-like chemotaxis protein